MSLDELRRDAAQIRAKALEEEATFLVKHGLKGALPSSLFREWIKLEKDLFYKELAMAVEAKESKQ